MKLELCTVAFTLLFASVSAVPAATPSKSSSTSSTKPAGSATAAAQPCSSQVMALAAGINDNIADQRNEMAAVTAVGEVLNEQPTDQTNFAASKASLLDFVNKGISIRENNQKIAPAGNAAIPGLAKVAMAQMAEFNLTNSLTGNVATDNKTVETLKSDFMDGITQNMKNLAAATSNCKATNANQGTTG